MPIAVVALFSSLNLTFMAYEHKNQSHTMATGIQPGENLPDFKVVTRDGHEVTNSPEHLANLMMNFVAPHCHFCQEQLPIINAIALQKPDIYSKLINVSPVLDADLLKLSPHGDWIEDREGTMRGHFKVLGYPTLFIFDDQGKIKKVIAGVSNQLQTEL